MGKINTDPLEIIEVSKMNPWAKGLLGREASRKTRGLNAAGGKERQSEEGERPLISSHALFWVSFFFPWDFCPFVPKDQNSHVLATGAG